MPSFEVFCERLIREQSKLQQLDALSSSQSLLALTSKGKAKYRPQKKKDSDKGSEPPSKSQKKSKSSPDTTKYERYSSKTGKKNSNESCSFCGREGHPKSKCYKKLEALNEAMKQHNISVSKPSSSGKGHALSARSLHASSRSWIFDLGASHHMTHSSESLQSLYDRRISQIEVGNSSQLNVQGSSTVQFDNGCINNVLIVPDISSNLLSIYQICHSSDGKTIEFSPNSVVIRELQDP